MDVETVAQGYYTYCIIRTDQDRSFDVPPLDSNGNNAALLVPGG